MVEADDEVIGEDHTIFAVVGDDVKQQNILNVDMLVGKRTDVLLMQKVL